MGLPDVDIDVFDRDKAISLFPKAVQASVLNEREGILSPHPSGAYFQDIPRDLISGLAAFPHKIAEDLGYFKLDFINYGVYEDIASEKELKAIIAIVESPNFPWKAFLDEKYYGDGENKITHLRNHYDLVKMYPPKSVLDVAALLALIRPAKRSLIGKPWHEISEGIWSKENDGTYAFKKSHAVAFAMVACVHILILLVGERN